MRTEARSEPRVGLAHADAEIALAARDARQDRLALLFAAELQQQRAGLAVGHPVRAGRGAVAEQLLGHDVAVEEARSPPPYCLGQVMPSQPLAPSALLNSGDARVPAREAILGLDLRQRLLEERADFAAQRLGLGRQMERREFELGDGHRHLGGWMPLLCRLILCRATREFRGSNAPPSTSPAAAPGGIRR